MKQNSLNPPLVLQVTTKLLVCALILMRINFGLCFNTNENKLCLLIIVIPVSFFIFLHGGDAALIDGIHFLQQSLKYAIINSLHYKLYPHIEPIKPQKIMLEC